jgi:drug/metabolite transporter (DMT)-like permease
VSEEQSISPRHLLLLSILTLFWGMNWSVMKYGVRELPPLWFRFLGVVFGTVVLYLYAQLRGASLAVPRGGWPRIALLALPNMIVWYLVAILAIAMLPSGRAAILGYTMPIWAALIGALFLGERLAARTWLGVGCALVATLLLVEGEWGSLAGHPLGAGLMLFAAASWGAGTHLLRRVPLVIDTLALTFWMMVMTSVALFAASWLFERHAWAIPAGLQWLPIAYNAVFVLGLCNVLWFALARSLPPVASGLSGMLVPVVGVFSGILVLGETPTWTDAAGLVLILAALATVVLPVSRAVPETARRI